MLCPQLKQNLETIKTLKSELDLELPKLKELFKIFKNGNPSTSLSSSLSDEVAQTSESKDRAERKDLMNKIKSLKTEIDLNIKTVKKLLPTKIISAISPEGKEIKFELKEQLKYWNDFYKDEGVNWVFLPEKIKITKEQQKEMERLITEFGFDEMIIIPENLAATGDNYEKLHTLMIKGYNETRQSNDFKTDGGFAGLKNKSNKLRIILTKNIKELDDDELFKQTLGKKMVELTAPDGILTINKLEGLGADVYLVKQRKHFKETGKHLDEKKWTWLPEVEATSGHVSCCRWSSDDGWFRFYAGPSTGSGSDLGCRLAGSFEIE
jgi:hypothetical protein